jgi:hypothetical protein
MNWVLLKNIFIYFFAIIGIISLATLTSKIYNLYQNEKLISEYYKNCEKVKVGMTLTKAREIIGDSKYQYWTQDNKSGEIIIREVNSEFAYSLEYPVIFAGSHNMSLKFDPISMLVTDIYCGN